MNIILYTTQQDETVPQLQQMIEKVIPDNDLELYHTLDDLSFRLLQPKDDHTAAILLSSNREELLELGFLKNKLKNLPLLLVVSDQEAETLNLAQKLDPIFLGTTNTSLEEFVQALITLTQETI